MIIQSVSLSEDRTGSLNVVTSLPVSADRWSHVGQIRRFCFAVLARYKNVVDTDGNPVAHGVVVFMWSPGW